MTLLARAPSSALPDPVPGAVFEVPYRLFEAAPPGVRRLAFTIGFSPRPRPEACAALRAAAGFLTDCAHGAVDPATLARMIGSYALAAGAAGSGALSVALANNRGERAVAHLDRPEFEVERTGFGAAHVLHEDETLGLYVLEIAPGRGIPAHCHRLMREWELILDEGLLQQERPVPLGAAFEWPLGHVHAYRNPTARPLRILCIDSPRFTPDDEAPLDPPPPLAPLAPFAEYTV